MLGVVSMEASQLESLSLPTLNGNGWKHPDSATLVVDWDSDDNLSLVQARVVLIRSAKLAASVDDANVGRMIVTVAQVVNAKALIICHQDLPIQPLNHHL